MILYPDIFNYSHQLGSTDLNGYKESNVYSSYQLDDLKNTSITA